jgi:tetratricopeptide (TPR) repeat protein
MQPLEQLAKRSKGLVVKRPGFAMALWGEPGIGKTFAVTQFLREALCKNLSLHATINLSSFANALPKPKKLPAWAELMLEKLERNEHLSTEQSTRVLGEVLSESAPFILHLEDIHEASLERLEWITALAKVILGLKGVALIVTSRTEPPEPFESIRLEVLDFEAVKNLLESEARASLPTEVIEWIHGKAAGNPLFALEFFKSLARQGYVWNDGKQWRWRKPEHEVMPARVEVLLEETLKKVANTPELKVVLDAKAVLGLGASDHLWHEVVGLEPQVFWQSYRTLEQQGILSNNEFAHPLFREISFKQLSKEQHARLAKKTIQALTNDPEKACQFIEAANLEPAVARALLDRAVLQTQQAGHQVRAMRLLAQSIVFAPHSEREALILKTAQVLQHVDIQLTTQLLEMIPSDVPPSQEFIVFVAEFWAQSSNLERALKTIEQLPQPRSESEWFGHLVRLHACAGNHAYALELWNSHPELASQSDLKTVVQICTALTSTGQHLEAERQVKQALERSRIEAENIFALKSILAAAFAYQGKTQSALELWDELLTAWTDERFTSQRLQVTVNSAQVRLRLGQLQTAHDLLIQGLLKALELGNFRILVHAQVLLGDVLTKQAKYDQAEEKLLEAYSLLRDKPSVQLFNVGLALSNLYQYWVTAQSDFLAHRYARLALSTAQALQNPMLVLSALSKLVQTEVKINDLAAAREHAAQALQSAQQLQHPVLRIAALNAQGLVLEALLQHDDALWHFREALTMSEQIGSHELSRQFRFDIARMTHDLETIREIRTQHLEHGLQNEVELIDRACVGMVGFVASPIQEEKVKLHLELLGSLQINLENKSQTIRGRKRQELLTLLLEARVSGKSELMRLELFDALYPNEDEDRAASSLKDLIHQIRENLGADTVQTTQNGYALGAVTSDVETFLTTGDSSLWRGVYLQGLAIEGALSIRDSLEMALQNCVQKLLKTDPKEAARVSRFLLELNLYDLENLRLSVTALKACENYKTLGRVYTDARERLLDVGEMLPERWQDFLELQNLNRIPA